MISGKQSVAARGLIGWTIADLCRESGLSHNTVVAFENATRPASADTIAKISEAFERSGIEFTPRGVQQTAPVYNFSGDTWFLDLVEDIRKNLKDGDELLAENIDDRKSTPVVKAAIDGLLAMGIKLRVTTSDDNPVMTYDPFFYRHIPARFFKNWVVLVYGERVAFSTNNESGCTVIRDHGLADAMRNRFDLVWHLVKK